MPDRGVIDDEVDDDADTQLLGVVHELDVLAERAVLRMHAVELGDVVPVVEIRRGIERLQPDAGDAETGEVIELARQPVEVANAIAIAIEVFLDVHAVEDGVLVPKIVDHTIREFSLSGQWGYSSG